MLWSLFICWETLTRADGFVSGQLDRGHGDVGFEGDTVLDENGQDQEQGASMGESDQEDQDQEQGPTSDDQRDGMA